MNNFIIRNYNFMAAINEKIKTEGFNFFSILTNGAFNPRLNYGISGTSQFYFTTNDNYKYYVNGELSNLDISGTKFLTINYAAISGYLLGGGYGDIFVVLSKYPYFPTITKKYAEYSETLNCVFGLQTWRWLGERGAQSKVLGIPFIQPHNYIQYFVQVSGGTNPQIVLYSYNDSDNENTVSNALPLDISGEVNIEYNSFNRYFLDFFNTAGTTQFKIAMSFSI